MPETPKFDALKAWIDLYDYVIEEKDRVRNLKGFDPALKDAADIALNKIRTQMLRSMPLYDIKELRKELASRNDRKNRLTLLKHYGLSRREAFERKEGYFASLDGQALRDEEADEPDEWGEQFYLQVGDADELREILIDLDPHRQNWLLYEIVDLSTGLPVESGNRRDLMTRIEQEKADDPAKQ